MLHASEMVVEKGFSEYMAFKLRHFGNKKQSKGIF